eukprot:g1036.t1
MIGKMRMRKMFPILLVLTSLFSYSLCYHNVVHIVVDDLRPEIAAYGVTNAHTPNLDRLASEGVVFERAYCQQAVCGPSRNSFMSGRRPDRSRTWNFKNHFREDHPEWTSLPGVFLQNENFVALGSGKLYHPNQPPLYDTNRSWSDIALPYYNPCWNTADDKNAKFKDGGLPCVPCLIDIEHYVFKKKTSIANEFCSTDAYEDTFSVSRAIKLMQKAVAMKKQFYLGLGFHKPHLPWQYSSADYNLHKNENISLPKYPLPPKNMPDMAFHFTDGSAPGHTDPWHPVDNTDTINARRHYRAAVTGMDRKLGVFLKELKRLGIANETAIVLHGDHGWHLGEQGAWRKFTNFEQATRVPLIVKVPWLNTVNRSSDFVELVDILPTIVELAGLSLPAGETFDGISFVPLMNKTNSSYNNSKLSAFSQYPKKIHNMSRAWESNGIIHTDRNKFTHMGYTIRTHEWRYVEWVAWNQTTLKPIWSDVVARELYDWRNVSRDVSDGESINVADDDENRAVVENLSVKLREQFTS